ncbi:MAG: dihydropteroate synthase [Spirochaetales bacterium]|uniref:Dihydropteroate synthase n=1 Tax=Candidatus Thalassospirochaeta sargassi TaxID=3119039 RepID=A0AAJ1MN71_9SPIO|nr:dihydropteroate synthase [Spirochaetales bacterium]
MQIKLAGERTLSTTRNSFVMGILNATPDSFYSESRKPDLNAGLDSARMMIDEGADIIDIGGESTRPGSAYVEAAEEIKRVVPLIEGIRKFSDIAVSIDTRKADVAEAAIKAGADIVNDVSGLRDDARLGFVVSQHDVPVILMHMRGTPENMQRNPHYTYAVEEIINELEICISRAKSLQIPSEKIIIDPGIGFGKRLEDNLSILKNIHRFRNLGYMLLIGLSRKSFIGSVTGADVDSRLAGSLAANMYAAAGGAEILRVHDVKETVWMLDMLAAIEGAG